ncbi:NifU family protein [Buchnera aphidicola]|uniref:NifU family protein n=1 Tax=Buchnera aphidicola TaxID=9 RepID=UPI0031B7F5FF
MINISKSAQKYLKELLLKQNKKTGIRIFIINYNIKKVKCGMSYCFKEDIDEFDIIVKYFFFNVYVNKVEMKYLKNTIIDLSLNDLGINLIISPPLLKSKIFKKNNILEKKLINYLDTVINPNLILHKGKVSLKNINKKKYALLIFSGGCNGCSMINKTLKDNIEKKIIEKFSTIKGVIDVTKHIKGKHSYSYFF